MNNPYLPFDPTTPVKKKKMPVWGYILIVLAVCALAFGGYMLVTRVFNKRPPAKELLLTAAGLSDELRDAANYNVSDEAQLLMLENAQITVLSDKRDSITATISAPDAAAILGGIADSADFADADTAALTRAFCDRLRTGAFPRVENTVTVTVASDDAGWYAESSRELFNAFFGGILDYYDSNMEAAA